MTCDIQGASKDRMSGTILQVESKRLMQDERPPDNAMLDSTCDPAIPVFVHPNIWSRPPQETPDSKRLGRTPPAYSRSSIPLIDTPSKKEDDPSNVPRETPPRPRIRAATTSAAVIQATVNKAVDKHGTRGYKFPGRGIARTTKKALRRVPFWRKAPTDYRGRISAAWGPLGPSLTSYCTA